MPSINRPCRVLLVDDSVKALKSLQHALSLCDDIQVVGQCGTAQAMLLKVDELRPDVVITDLVFFDDERIGSRTIKKLKAGYPNTHIVAVTAYPAIKSAAATSGADFVMEKNYSTDELVQVIRSFSPPRSKDTLINKTLVSWTAVDSSLLALLFVFIAAVFFVAVNYLNIPRFFVALIPIFAAWYLLVIVLGSMTGRVGKTATYRLLLLWWEGVRGWIAKSARRIDTSTSKSATTETEDQE